MDPNIGDAKVVLLNDLIFDARYFHSATLRVVPIPNTHKLTIQLVVTLFEQGKMRDFGVFNADPSDTVDQFDDLLIALGHASIGVEGRIAMYQQKMAELRLVEDEIAKRQFEAESAAKRHEGRGAPPPSAPAEPIVKTS